MGFQGGFENAGRRGISVFCVENAGSGVSFKMQSRVVDARIDVDWSKVGPMLADANVVAITLADLVTIHYCPWCGRKLARWYRANAGELVRNDLAVGLRIG
jgi:hypothetical protein